MTSAPEIVSRKDWGATPWRSSTYHVDIEARDYLFYHYHGGTPRSWQGVEMAKEIERIHLNNGWSGVGYGFMVGLDGVAFEGRGWELVGAHCPNFNTRGMSIYFANDGKRALTDAQKVTGRWFRDKHQQSRAGKVLNVTTHGQHYPTACAGDVVDKWVLKDDLYVPNAPQIVVRPPVSSVPNTPTVVKVRLNVDGVLGANTIRALQQRLRDAGMIGLNGRLPVVDGDNGRNTTAALQRYLNKKLGGTDLVVDGYGFKQQNGYSSLTNRHLQRWLGSPQDGILSEPSSLAVRRMQDRLNRGNF